jgi:acyl dehydratase
MSTVADIPQHVKDLIGQVQYEQTSDFPAEQGYVWTTCASVFNGNPLYWDPAVAEEVTGGPTTPLSMLSIWQRPHYWAPGSEGEQLALQVHFDLKEKLQLPEAIISEYTSAFHEPVRMGDILSYGQVLKTVSDVKTTRLGTGRFWSIDVEYRNQRGELCGVETYVAFGYTREASK